MQNCKNKIQVVIYHPLKPNNELTSNPTSRLSTKTCSEGLKRRVISGLRLGFMIPLKSKLQWNVCCDQTPFLSNSTPAPKHTVLQRKGREEMEEREGCESLVVCWLIVLSFWALFMSCICGDCDSISRCQVISEEKAPTEIRGTGRVVQRIERPSWFRNNNNNSKKSHKMNQNKNKKKKKQCANFSHINSLQSTHCRAPWETGGG